VVAQATNENQLQTSVENIRRIWEKFDFKLNPYREYKDVFTLTEIDEVMQQLEEHQLQLQTMLGSRYVNAVREEVDIWDRKLNLVSEILDEWLNCQRNWMYLETIFSAPDIQKQMPAESKVLISNRYVRVEQFVWGFTQFFSLGLLSLSSALLRGRSSLQGRDAQDQSQSECHRRLRVTESSHAVCE
jgi:hypothetical protein